MKIRELAKVTTVASGDNVKFLYSRRPLGSKAPFYFCSNRIYAMKGSMLFFIGFVSSAGGDGKPYVIFFHNAGQSDRTSGNLARAEDALSRAC